MPFFGPKPSPNSKSDSKRRDHYHFMGFTVALAWILTQGMSAMADTAQDATNTKDAAEFIATALNPIWRATEIREPLFFVEGTGSDRPTGKLLFKPTEVLSITTCTRDTKFEPGKDFVVDI